MTFLPIVDRELRVAAHRKSTYRIRAYTAVLALGFGFFSLLPAMLTTAPGVVGKPIFTTLAYYAFGLCLLAGVLLTADCLSAEKRRDTLGLLFLTDLKGYDVVLGKFIARSLNAFYGLLALSPIAALCLLLGGLTGGEFWRTMLALANALFFSLAVGICISAFGRDAEKVIIWTLGVVFMVGVVLGVLLVRSLATGPVPGWQYLAWISPYCPLALAMEPEYLAHAEIYWGALFTSHLAGWLSLALASYALPHRWQERAGFTGLPKGLARFTRRTRRLMMPNAKTRERLLSINPVIWLASTRPDYRKVAWLITAVSGATLLAMSLFADDYVSSRALVRYGAGPFGFLLKWLFALQACRLFVEARRNGALEMLLCTPLTSRQLIDGQVLALRRTFLGPALVMLVLLFVRAVHQALTVRAGNGPDLFNAVSEFAGAGFYGVRMYADCAAITWFGMWLALTLKKPGFAPSLTILLILILPSTLCWLDAFADIFFIWWGVIKLRQEDIRHVIARQFLPPRTKMFVRTPVATPRLPTVIAS